MEILNGTIRHHQTMFEFKILPIVRGLLDCMLHESRISDGEAPNQEVTADSDKVGTLNKAISRMAQLRR